MIGAMLAGPLIGLIGDEEFVDAWWHRPWRCCSSPSALRFVSDTVSQGLFAAHQQRFLLWVAIGALAFNIVLNCVLAGRYGAVGAGVAHDLSPSCLPVASPVGGCTRCGYRCR